MKFNTPAGNVPIPPDIAAQQGTFTGKNNPLVAFGRLDYQLNEKNSVNLQYTYAAQYGLSFNVAAGQTSIAATNNSILDRESQGVKAGWTSVITSNLVGRGAFDYWESGLDLRFGRDMYNSFVRYQSRLIRVFDSLAEPYGFQVIDATRPAVEVFESLKTSVSEIFDGQRRKSVHPAAAPKPVKAIVRRAIA